MTPPVVIIRDGENELHVNSCDASRLNSGSSYYLITLNKQPIYSYVVCNGFDVRSHTERIHGHDFIVWEKVG